MISASRYLQNCCGIFKIFEDHKDFFVRNLEGSPAKTFVEALPNFGRAPYKKNSLKYTSLRPGSGRAWKKFSWRSEPTSEEKKSIQPNSFSRSRREPVGRLEVQTQNGSEKVTDIREDTFLPCFNFLLERFNEKFPSVPMRL